MLSRFFASVKYISRRGQLVVLYGCSFLYLTQTKNAISLKQQCSPESDTFKKTSDSITDSSTFVLYIAF